MADEVRILGPDGRPLRAARQALTERRARPSVVGLRSAWQWRSIISDLTADRLRGLIQSIAAGQWCPEWWELAEEIEERDLHYRGVLQQRRLGAAGSPLDVRPASDAARDVALAEEVRQRILQGPGWHDMALDLLDALAKGVSCQEIVWAARHGRLVPAAYHRIDPRWLVWDRDDGETPYLVGGRGDAAAHGDRAPPFGGEPLRGGKYVYHHHRSKSGLATRGGLAYSVAAIYLLRSLSVRDWWAFGGIYGLPIRLGKYGPDASEEDIDTLVEAVSQIAADAGCVIPDSMTIDVIQAVRGGGAQASLFREQVAWCEAQISKAVVGQTMTADDGASLSQAQVHAGVRDDLVADDVRQMCETINAAIVAPYCALNHAPRAAGWPRIAPPAEEADIDVAAVTAAAGRGLRIPAAWVRERMGIPEPREGDEVLSGLPVGGAPAGAGRRDRHGGGGQGDHHDHGGGLHAADEWGDGEWMAVADDLAQPVLNALEAARSPGEFLALAGRAGTPADLAAGLARRAFESRVDGETDQDAA